jgi:hypothetical protein
MEVVDEPKDLRRKSAPSSSASMRQKQSLREMLREKLCELVTENFTEMPFFLLHESNIRQRPTCPELPMLRPTNYETVR